MINIFHDFSQMITLQAVSEKDGRKLLPEDLSIIQNGAVVFDDDEILWIGPSSQIPSSYKGMRQNFSNHIILPEIVDCHTHLVFGGDRSHEYALRLNGANYEEIAKQGGGILSTMQETNSLSSDELFDISCSRIQAINSYGVGTIEIKSGYGLNYQKEEEISELIYKLKKHFEPHIQIHNTFMAAHAVPKTFSSSSHYLQKEVLPLLSSLATKNILDSVDIFHEKGYFDQSDVIKLFDLATKLNLPCKSHADEFADNKGALLATKYHAISTDHLLCTAPDGIYALANSNTVTTLLPGTGLFLGKAQANGRAFLDAGCKVAIGSDYNPGSCHCDNLLLLASIAAPIYEMNIAELIASITHNSAHALNLKKQGALIAGKKPRFSIFNINSIEKLSYNWGKNFSINQ